MTEEKTGAPTDVISMVNISRVLTYGTGTIRVFGTSEKPWFHGADVATSLGYVNTRKALLDHVKDKNKTSGKNISRCPVSGHLDKYEKQAIFIDEGGLYSLIMQSKKAEAEAFQTWVTDEILPSIRKTGSYQLNAQLQTLTSELTNQRLLLDKVSQEANEAKMKIESEQKRADDAESEARRARQEKLDSDEKHREELNILELASTKTKNGFKDQLNSRSQYVYVITNDQYRARDIYKIGRTKNKVNERAGGLNTGHINNDSLYCVASYSCADAQSIEDRAHKLLSPHRDSPDREFFQIPFGMIHTLITNMIKHQSEEYEWACALVDDVIGRPLPCGKDAAEYISAMAQANAAAEVPVITNKSLAQEAMGEWLSIQKQTQKSEQNKFDWINYQVFLRAFLEKKKIPKTKYRAREWKDLSVSAFDGIRAPSSIPICA